MKEDESNKIYDFNDYPILSAYNVHEIQFLRTDARVVLFDWVPIDGVWRKKLIGVIKRPAHTICAEVCSVYPSRTVTLPGSAPALN